eukprot:TRINITY_DN3347_c0_g2_i1.p2 TRINITY_DN3347_c0_g2~~TRINITY_DN3347_c0_g2_i1.p2  ORF type:complete len:236 (-),score=-16.11 TRINITY_DN3347_c0_g2_i1:715-1422(-)
MYVIQYVSVYSLWYSIYIVCMVYSMQYIWCMYVFVLLVYSTNKYVLQYIYSPYYISLGYVMIRYDNEYLVNYSYINQKVITGSCSPKLAHTLEINQKYGILLESADNKLVTIKVTLTKPKNCYQNLFLNMFKFVSICSFECEFYHLQQAHNKLTITSIKRVEIIINITYIQQFVHFLKGEFTFHQAILSSQYEYLDVSVIARSELTMSSQLLLLLLLKYEQNSYSRIVSIYICIF